MKHVVICRILQEATNGWNAAAAPERGAVRLADVIFGIVAENCKFVVEAMVYPENFFAQINRLIGTADVPASRNWASGKMPALIKAKELLLIREVGILFPGKAAPIVRPAAVNCDWIAGLTADADGTVIASSKLPES